MEGQAGHVGRVVPFQRSTAASSIADALRDELLSGALPPGTLLHDADLVSRTGAGRATVRAALAELVRDGLLIHSLHGSVEVARISPQDVGDIYAARRVYEGAGLEALLRRRPVDVSWLRAAAERMGEAAVAVDGRAAVEADMAFHLALVASAGSHHLTSASQGALMELRLVLSLADRLSDDLPALVAAHEHLVEVFQEGRLRRARAVLEEHLVHGEAVARAAAAASMAA
ncbi:MAG: GntR family transcriptional regulator [Solirubrobacteraceae bacterium]